MLKELVATTCQPINLVRTSSGTVEIPYEDGDELIHYIDDTGEILHNPNYPDPDCPCYDDDEQGDTSSDFAFALVSYQHDFFSIAPAGYNTGGLWLERRIAERILRGAV